MIDFIEVRIEKVQQADRFIRALITVKDGNQYYKMHTLLEQDDFHSTFDLLWDNLKDKVLEAIRRNE